MYILFVLILKAILVGANKKVMKSTYLNIVQKVEKDMVILKPYLLNLK